MTYSEVHHEASVALTACAWFDVRCQVDSSTVTAMRRLVNRHATIEVTHSVKHWSAKIILNADGIGVSAASTAAEAILAAERDATYNLSEMARLCGSAFGRTP